MQIVGLSLKEKSSQIAYIDAQPEFIDIKRVGIIEEPILEYVINGDTQTLSAVLTQLTKQPKNAKLLISYPSRLGFINCFEAQNVIKDKLLDALIDLVGSHLPVEKKDDFYFDAPLIIPHNEGCWITGMCLHHYYVDTMIEAARMAGYRDIEGEPEAVVTARLLNNRQQVSYFIEIEDDFTTIISYHPEKGMFSIPAPNIGWHKILENEGGVRTLKEQLVITDVNTYQKFGFEADYQNNIDIYIISPKRTEIMQVLEEYTSRIRDFILPEYVQSGINPDFLIEFVGPVGLGVKPMMERVNRQNEVAAGGEYLSGPENGSRENKRKKGLGIPLFDRIAHLFALRNNH